MRGSVGGEEYGEAGCPERFEEALQDHGVSHVKHLELIDSEKRHWGGEEVTDYGYGVALLATKLLVNFVFGLVHLKHEFVVMEAEFLTLRNR